MSHCVVLAPQCAASDDAHAVHLLLKCGCRAADWRCVNPPADVTRIPGAMTTANALLEKWLRRHRAAGFWARWRATPADRYWPPACFCGRVPSHHPVAQSTDPECHCRRSRKPSPASGDQARAEARGSHAPQHVLTVTLEDYYHVKAFNRLIHSGQWYRFENRLERNTDRTLDLLDETKSKATFFVFGHLAESMPELVRKIVDRGHEVGSRGMYPRDIAQLTPGRAAPRPACARRRRSRRPSGHTVRGFRAGEIWNNPDDLWILDLIAEAGYQYDSSFCPWMRRAKDRPDLLLTHRRTVGDRDLWVLPISSFSMLGWRLPLGGNFLRQFPRPLVRHELKRWAIEPRGSAGDVLQCLGNRSRPAAHRGRAAAPAHPPVPQPRPDVRPAPGNALGLSLHQRRRLASRGPGDRRVETIASGPSPRASSTPALGSGEDVAAADAGDAGGALLQRGQRAGVPAEHAAVGGEAPGRPLRPAIRLRGRLQHRQHLRRRCRKSFGAQEQLQGGAARSERRRRRRDHDRHQGRGHRDRVLHRLPTAATTRTSSPA